jgi:hypothetical protein
MDDILTTSEPQCDHIYLFEDIIYDGGVLRKKSEGPTGYADTQVFFKYCPECGQKLNPEENGANCENGKARA